MARIVKLPPTPATQTRWQVRYQREHSSAPADISPSNAEALSIKRAAGRGEVWRLPVVGEVIGA